MRAFDTGSSCGGSFEGVPVTDDDFLGVGFFKLAGVLPWPCRQRDR